MSDPNGTCSLSCAEYHQDEFGTEFIRYTPDGPWIMLGPQNTSSVQVSLTHLFEICTILTLISYPVPMGLHYHKVHSF